MSQKRKAEALKNNSILNFFKKKKVESHTVTDTNIVNDADNIQIQLHLQQMAASSLSEAENECSSSFDIINVDSNDIGLFIGKQITSREREHLLTNVWKPLQNHIFPSTTFGKRQLKFQNTWFNNRDWLTYSKKLDGAFCKYCALFAPSGAGRQGLPLGKLVRVEYKNWKNAIEDFEKHQLNTYHVSCMIHAENFLQIQAGKKNDIITNIDKNVRETVIQNRRLLTPIIKTVLFCGRQGLALRGHRDSGPVEVGFTEEIVPNEGNFRALLRFRLESGDDDLRNHLLNAAKNATYVSWASQNDIISASSSVALSKLVRRVNSAKCFSILADETADVSCTEQLSLCARYVDMDNLYVREDFLQFVPIYDMTGKGISDAILSKLREIGTATEYLRGQGYDGASAMSGDLNGVQSHIKKLSPNALYVHCSSHSLNLAISDSCSSAPIRNCIGTISKVYDFFHTPKRQEVLDRLSEGRSKKLKQPSPTRWIQRHDAVKVFVDLFDYVLKALKEIALTWTDRDSSSTASIFHNSVTKCDFIISLYSIKKVFSHSLPLSKYLQSEKSELSTAVSYVQDTKEVVKKLRDNAEEEFSVLLQEIEKFCESHDVAITVPRTTERQTIRNNVEYDTPETYYRRSIYVSFLDHFIFQLNERFLNHTKILTAFQILLSPSMIGQSSQELVKTLCQQYCDDIGNISSEVLYGEMKMWHTKLQRSKKTFSNALETLQECDAAMYPAVQKLLQIMTTLPVTTCSVERTFSTLRYLKNYLRSSMRENRLNGLALLYIHKDVVVTPEGVLNEMAKTPRRVNIKL